MITTVTWQNDCFLQKKFDQSLNQIAKSKHKLAKNYNLYFNKQEIVCYSMTYDFDQIYLCSTVGIKSNWPDGVYRLINRVFKPFPTRVFTKKIDFFWKDMINQQLDYCKKIENFQLAIISRKIGYSNTLLQLKKQIDNESSQWILHSTPLWIIDNFNDPECYQQILYYGNSDLLKNFKS